MFSFIKFRQKKQVSPVKDVWFYRAFGRDEFIEIKNTSDTPLNLIKKDGEVKSILIKKNGKCFCPYHFKWEKIENPQSLINEIQAPDYSKKQELISSDSSEPLTSLLRTIHTTTCTLNGLPFYYPCEFDFETNKNNNAYTCVDFRGSQLFYSIRDKERSLEDLSAEELRSYLADYRRYKSSQKEEEKLREEEELYKNKPSSCFVSNKINRNILLYHFISDEKKFTLTLKQYSINTLMFNNQFPYMEHEIDEVPFLCLTEEYDVKNGKYFSSEVGWQKFTRSINVNSVFYPDEIFSFCEKEIWRLTQKLLGRKLKFPDLSASMNEASFTYRDYQNHDFYNDTTYRNLILCALLFFPYEPLLYKAFLVRKDSFSSIKKDNPYRLDSNCYKNFCNSLGFSSFKSLRTLFNKNQGVLSAYKILTDAGMKDKNIIISILSDENNTKFLLYCSQTHLNFFLQWAVPLKGEKAAWNLITRNLKNSEDSSDDAFFSTSHFIPDCLYMFMEYFNNLDYEVRRAILKDGFTRYNHDLLANIGKKIEEANVDFVYTDEEKSLEDSIDGYQFILPKDYYELVNVATALHNCAASYKKRILTKKTLVMYAKKDEQYCLCIEVRGKTVHQERADRNSTPVGADSLVMKKWRQHHNLEFHGNYY